LSINACGRRKVFAQYDSFLSFYHSTILPSISSLKQSNLVVLAKMVVVAVAGGVGHVGRTIVEVLSESTKHDVIILARKAPEEKVSAAPVYIVDYSDIQGVAELLARQNVHTVISTISVTSEAASAAEVNLIKAAAKSSTAKRFVATGWGALPAEE